jgi:putative membrane protein
MSPGGGAPQAQQPTNPSATSTTNSPDAMQQQQASTASVMQDKEFVRKALEGGMAEVQLGQLAAEKARPMT